MSQDFPDDDSPDLTDEEIAEAIRTVDASHFAKLVVHLSCPSCGGHVDVAQHERKRRKPDHFTRMTLRCAQNHTVVKLFRINWVEFQ